ncbi:hypothetical protein L7F22_058919 [Adiantum nelumboides]|nr:hypothetical protein [Adiantum nelumboides]
MAEAETEAEALRRLEKVARFGSTIERAKRKIEEDEEARVRARARARTAQYQVFHSSGSYNIHSQPANPSTNVASELHMPPSGAADSGHHRFKPSGLALAEATSLASPCAHKRQNKPASTGAPARRRPIDISYELKQEQQRKQPSSAQCRPTHHNMKLDVYPSPRDRLQQKHLPTSRRHGRALYYKDIHCPQYQSKQQVQPASGAARGPTHHKVFHDPASHERHQKRLRHSKDDLHCEQRRMKSELKQINNFEIRPNNRQPVPAANMRCPVLSSKCSSSVDGPAGYSCSSSSDLTISSSSLSHVKTISPDVSTVNTTTGYSTISHAQSEDASPTSILAHQTPSRSVSHTHPRLRHKCPPPPPSREELLQKKRREARAAMDAIQQTVFFDDAYSIIHDFLELINYCKPGSGTAMPCLSDQPALSSSTCTSAASSSNVDFVRHHPFFTRHLQTAARIIKAKFEGFLLAVVPSDVGIYPSGDITVDSEDDEKLEEIEDQFLERYAQKAQDLEKDALEEVEGGDEENVCELETGIVGVLLH